MIVEIQDDSAEGPRLLERAGWTAVLYACNAPPVLVHRPVTEAEAETEGACRKLVGRPAHGAGLRVGRAS